MGYVRYAWRDADEPVEQVEGVEVVRTREGRLSLRGPSLLIASCLTTSSRYRGIFTYATHITALLVCRRRRCEGGGGSGGGGGYTHRHDWAQHC